MQMEYGSRLRNANRIAILEGQLPLREFILQEEQHIQLIGELLREVELENEEADARREADEAANMLEGYDWSDIISLSNSVQQNLEKVLTLKIYLIYQGSIIPSVATFTKHLPEEYLFFHIQAQKQKSGPDKLTQYAHHDWILIREIIS